MPSSKTDTALRYPEDDDQRRRLRNVTQDRKAVDRMQTEAGSGQRKAEDKTSWAPEQMLGFPVDQSGNPEPDPATYADGNKAKGAAKAEEDVDLYAAMNDNFD